MSYKYLLLILPFFLLSCKQEIKKTEPSITDQIISKQKKIDQEMIHKKEVSEQKIKADTAITKSTILLLSPDEQEIEEIKKRQGEDNFYTIADDANYYSAEIYEAAPKAVYSNYKTIDFPNENYVFDKKKSEDKWLVIDYKLGSKPKIYSLVDYYRHITEK
ncbi:hypothetical protein [Chryseobacterium jejuense]|uniref:hypothetical protein n=1 Tax=Chryseobacterium jejuense TaxID=445960 RepID=UPI001AEA6800|nr:hypothetical protein [Chryseobacterium jejuense]MBP2616719.1 hypothetical protein [Chryseobacterium jejuense]